MKKTFLSITFLLCGLFAFSINEFQTQPSVNTEIKGVITLCALLLLIFPAIAFFFRKFASEEKRKNMMEQTFQFMIEMACYTIGLIGVAGAVIFQFSDDEVKNSTLILVWTGFGAICWIGYFLVLGVVLLRKKPQLS